MLITALKFEFKKTSKDRQAIQKTVRQEKGAGHLNDEMTMVTRRKALI